MIAAELWMDSQNVLEKFPLIFRLNRLRFLKPRVEIFIENSQYTVETISQASDLREIFRLRYDVFFREFAGRGDRFSMIPYDLDFHDFACDHLVVREKTTRRLVATYRVLFQDDGEEKPFYTETEFDLSWFRLQRGKKLELGRACVHKDFRTGAVISLLWKGLCQYAKKTRTQYMFGCSSVSRSEFTHLPYILDELERRGCALRDFDVPVKKDFQLSSHPRLHLPTDVSADSVSMPSLMNMYLLAGAKMSTEFAYDEEMDCLDFFTVLDFTNLPSSFERRFA